MDAVMDAVCDALPSASESDGPSVGGPTGPKRRTKLWELPTGYHCSIIGTCLSHEDLVAALPRLQLRLIDKSQDYEVHGFFVDKAGSDNPVARHLQKLLEKKSGGEIRRFARAESPAELSALWARALEDGRVGPAFWALLSHPLTTAELRSHAHGQVHMLSHHMNGTNQYHLRRRSAAEQCCRDLQEAYERLQRSSRKEVDALKADLEQAKAAQVAIAPPESVVRSMVTDGPSGSDRKRDKRAVELERLKRKLQVERQRARVAESELARLKESMDALPTLWASAQGRVDGDTDATDGCPACAGGTGDHLKGRTVLYVGGRLRAVPVLEKMAGRFEAWFLFHDGGLQDSLRTLDHLVERCDLVCCPVDCVSHGACQRTKQLCKRHRVPFLPLRTSSAANFLAALRAARPGTATATTEICRTCGGC